MSIETDDILEQAHALRENGEPFALATVVRVTRPASARPGAKALVRADGAIAGWVGGSCAQPAVAREALAALARWAAAPAVPGRRGRASRRSAPKAWSSSR